MLFEDAIKLISNNYEDKEQKFLLFVLNSFIARRSNYYDDRALLNTYNNIFGIDPSISTATQGALPQEKRGGSGDSPDSSSQNAVIRQNGDVLEKAESSPLVDIAEPEIKPDIKEDETKVEVGGIPGAIDGGIRTAPLDQIGGLIQQPLNELGIYIDPVGDAHAISIFHVFDPDNELFKKIVDGLKPQWSKTGWAWPELYTDKVAKIKASFTVQMHKNGHFKIPIRRNPDLEEFFEDLGDSFDFLTPIEIETLLSLLKRDDTGDAFIHLATGIGPEQAAKEKLNKSLVRIRFVNHFGVRKTKFYVDESLGKIELEGQGPETQVRNMMNILSGPADVTGSLIGQEHLSKKISRGVDDLQHGQTILYSNIQSVGSTVQVLQQQVMPRQDILAEFSELGITIDNKYQLLDLKRDIDHAQLLDLINKKAIPQLKELIIETDRKGSTEHIQMRTALATTIAQLLNFDAMVHQDLTDLGQRTTTLITDTTREIIEHSEQHSKNISTEIHTAKNEICQKIDDLYVNIRTLISSEFNNSRVQYRHSLELMIRALYHIPSQTAQELFTKIKSDSDLSKITLYRYLKSLMDKKILVQKKGFSPKGRSSKVFSLNDEILKKIK